MAWLVLSNKMDVCYLLLYVQEIRIQPYFCVKQGEYFFPLFSKDPVYLKIGINEYALGLKIKTFKNFYLNLASAWFYLNNDNHRIFFLFSMYTQNQQNPPTVNPSSNNPKINQILSLLKKRGT